MTCGGDATTALSPWRLGSRRLMHLGRAPLLIGVLLIALVIAGYLISDTVPIFIAAVVGLPAAAYILNRTSPEKTES